MGKITAITSQTKNKNRCNLYIDEEFFSGLSLETVIKNRLKVGDEIETEKLQLLLAESERSTALDKALTYISKTFKTKRQVKDYLIKKGYSEEIAWEVVDKLKEYNYIDDVEYSSSYIKSVSKNNGKRLIEYKLMMKGVRKDDIEKAYENTDVNSKENARQIAIKYMRNKENTKENVSKTYRYLLGKGFSYDEADFAVKNMIEDN